MEDKKKEGEKGRPVETKINCQKCSTATPLEAATESTLTLDKPLHFIATRIAWRLMTPFLREFSVVIEELCWKSMYDGVDDSQP